ncbi:putative chromosome segregation in meiosis protein 3 protein [Zalerion maritima]|uniref:Chromosome segregation in meiosis protein n=1 Tax=Zalerion maritima TaxID=339359 RepID=A0AAD5RKF8_9PEZI|nr:putative chromosome segregation in meiosis protein 3 protein [Zalerion maritima]
MADLDEFDVDDFNFDEIREPSPQPNKRKQDEAGLGIDEEVSVAKRPRAPAVKLDEAKLLSDKGIPNLRQRARKLKFRGKGHEFSDAAHLLEFYQEWLDHLFPKAKFLDGLAMVEKLGHKIIIRKQRLEWINEEKPKDIDDVDDGAPPPQPQDTADKHSKKLAPMFEKTSNGDIPKTPDVDADAYIFGDDAAVIDLMPRVEKTSLEERSEPPMMSGALGGASGSIFGPASRENSTPTTSTSKGAGKNGSNTDKDGDDEDEDDLDALMAEAEADSMARNAPITQPTRDTRPPDPINNDFADEEAAMAEMDGLW